MRRDDNVGAVTWSDLTLRRISFFIALTCSAFTFRVLNWPQVNSFEDLFGPLLFTNTTPSGGDMGAHVWGPAFLRDQLLPSFRLAGWTPDWYAGFPAYHFYMVVPSLVIVALNAGLPPLVAIPLLVVSMGGLSWLSRHRDLAWRWVLLALVLAWSLLVSWPYGVSFKLVSALGLVVFPMAAWAMGRLAGCREPVPAFLALAGLVFLFDTNFNIYGGNVASTLAGEFAFSISLCLALLAIGVALRGMDADRWRASSALLLALVVLCHLIPVFFLIPAVSLAVLAHKNIARTWVLGASFAWALVPLLISNDRSLFEHVLVGLLVLFVFSLAFLVEPRFRARALWLILVGPVSVALGAFWLLPFYLREPYFNDMGWERLNEVGASLLTGPMKMALPVAAIGLLMAFAARDRIGMIFGGTGLVFASGVVNLGEGPLWNARLLPFFYLSVYVLTAVGVGHVARYVGSLISGNLRRPSSLVLSISALVGMVAVLIAVAMPLRIMPFGQNTDEGTYKWLAFTNTEASFLPSWVSWNYSGYEQKPSYREYYGVVTAMKELCQSHGPGRAMWEYDKDLDRYGTPMALMLLPHWTDGCIGSMEGLYFESSATTPFHFLAQSTLSENPSRAQRDLPYLDFDIEIGVRQLQIMGVRYYMALSDVAIAAASDHPALEQVAEAQPFVIFEVADSELITALEYEPVVVSGPTEEQVAGMEDPDHFDVGWVSQAVSFFNSPQLYKAMPAESGPGHWLLREALYAEDGVALDPVEVQNIDIETDRISFSVSETDRPVLVKTSYFPNWELEGAAGPWRVGPNLMAVLPIDNTVQMRYGVTPVDRLSYGLTLVGVFALIGLYWLGRKGGSSRESP